MVLVCVHELDTRSRVPFSTSYDQFHAYGTRQHVDSFERRRPREPSAVDRTTAIAMAADSMHGPHSPIRSSPRTQGCSHEVCSTLRPVANASPSSMEGSHATSSTRRGRPEHEIAHAMPQGACERGSGHASQRRRAEELDKLPQRAKLLQPPFACQPAESCGRTVRNGRQGQPRAGGGF